MSRESRKTERMPGTPAHLGRTTEKMGGVRDTIQDAPRIYDTTGPEPQKALGPRGTVVVASPKKAETLGKPSDKAEAGEVVIRGGAAPRTMAAQKVDVSRVDPRRAPTQKIKRRPEDYLAHPGAAAAGAGHDARRRKGPSPMVLGVAVVVLLTIVVVVLVALLMKQRAAL